MINWIGFERTVLEVLSWHLPAGSEENYKKTAVRIASAPVGIQTEHRSNASLALKRRDMHPSP
jgi:hypothetical protein